MSNWIKYRKNFGYPECWFEAFIARNIYDNNIILPTRIQIRVGNSKGFIHCSYCCQKVISDQSKLEDLIKIEKNVDNFLKQVLMQFIFRKIKK